MDTSAPACALCGKTVGGAETAHAVRDKFVCDECRRQASTMEPRPVLAYAGGAVSRRRWLWLALASAAIVAAIAASMLITAQRAAVARAQAEQMRALAAEQRARAAAEAARGRLAETRPAD